MNPSLTPWRSRNSSLRRRRRSMTALMSTSLKVVSIAAVCCASTSLLAMVWRRLEKRTRSSKTPRPSRPSTPGVSGWCPPVPALTGSVCSGGSRSFSRGLLARSAARLLPDRTLYVVARDAPARPAARDLGEVDLVLLGQLPHRRRGAARSVLDLPAPIRLLGLG